MQPPVHHIHIYKKPSELTSESTDLGTSQTTDVFVGRVGSNNWAAAQSFTPTKGGRLTAFSFYYASTTGTPSDDLAWQIYTNNGGVPGRILSSGAVASLSAGTINVTLSKPPLLQKDTLYFIVWKIKDQATANNYYTLRKHNSDVYSGGQALRDKNSAGTWDDLPPPTGHDMVGSFTMRDDDSLLVRYPLTSYNHELHAHGNDIAMSCELVAPRDEVEHIFQNYVGNRFEILVDNPAKPIFEGILWSANFSANSSNFMRTLDGMSNSVRASWNRSGPVSTKNTVADNTASQSIYGIIDVKMSAPYRSDTDTDAADAIRDGHLAKVAYPIMTILPGANSDSTLCRLEGKGIFETLAFDVVRTTVNKDTLDDIIKSVLDDLRNGNTFFNNVDQTQIATSTVDNTSDEDGDMTAKDAIKICAEIADGVTRYVVGIERSHPITKNRRLYFRAADETVKYLTYDRDQLRIRHSPVGRIVPPWDVRPDGIVRIQDIFVGWGGAGTDPRS